MTGAFHADLPGLEQLVERLSVFDRHADELMTELESHVRRVHGQWDGCAADAHLAAHRRWSADARRMRTAAGELRDLMSVARTNYSSAAEANLRMWS